MVRSKSTIRERVSRGREERRMVEELRNASPTMRRDFAEAVRRSASR